MLSNQRRKFKEYAGELKNALKLSELPKARESNSLKLSSLFKSYRPDNFKAQEYI